MSLAKQHCRIDMSMIRGIIARIVVLLLLIRLNATKDILHLGVLVSQEGELNLSGYIPAMDLALETIKNDTTLPFDFHVTLNDSMVSIATCHDGFSPGQIYNVTL